MYKNNFIKKIMLISIIIVMSCNTFAAIVSDNDGSAFVTKAEFDSLKNSFEEQIVNYNNSIDSKIDGAIAAYLAGIAVTKIYEISTAYDLEGNDGKINFVGSTYIAGTVKWTNQIFSSDKLNLFQERTYNPKYADSRDSYHYAYFIAEDKNGDTNNKFFLVDDEGYVDSIYDNGAIKLKRIWSDYESANSRYGGQYTKINAELKFPTDVNGSAATEFKSLVKLTNQYVGWCIENCNGRQAIYSHLSTRTYTGYTGTPWTTKTGLYYTDVQDETLDDNEHIAGSWKFTFTKTEDKECYHFPFSSSANPNIMESFGDYNSIKKRYDTITDYTYVKKIDMANGPCAGLPDSAGTVIERLTDVKFQGYGVVPKLSTKGLLNLKYSNLKFTFGKDATLTNGLLLYYSTINAGNITVKFKTENDNMKLYFSNAKFGSTPPSDTDDSLIEFKYIKNGEPVVTAKTVELVKDTEYTFNIPYARSSELYMAANYAPATPTTNWIASIEQVGKARIEVE